MKVRKILNLFFKMLAGSLKIFQRIYMKPEFELKIFPGLEVIIANKN